MKDEKFRPGVAEFIALVALCLIGGLLALGFLSGWVIGLIPGFTFALGVVVSYLLYRQYVRERTITEPMASAIQQEEMRVLRLRRTAGSPEPLTSLATFLVVDARGVCPLGRTRGEVITLDRFGCARPQICTYAEAVLRQAANAGPEIDEWCCPIYEHMLVFRRQERTVELRGPSEAVEALI